MPRHASFAAFTVVVAAWTTSTGLADEPTADQVRFFETQVRPVLVENCAKCHSAGKSKGGLKLDSRATALAGGDTGPAIVPGKVGESLLIAAIKYEGPEMPPNKKLSREQVSALSRWVEMGAPWPGGDDVPAEVAPSSTIRKPGYKITDKDRDHWAFRPIKPPAIPPVQDNSWVHNPIDAFILAKLEARGLKPNPPASKSELIRRATYDLTGLPPTPAELEAFLKDESPDAYEKLVDRLLASPRYGESWARHWLDLVRFAETNSYERDGVKPSAWRYRDYVIRSLNADKPYDRFVREQLAGDELSDGGIDGKIATGFYRLGIWDDEPSDRDQALFDGFDDVVATTSQVFLGLTVDCARCHDHKIDPIPQKDYYKLVAFFRNITPYRNGGSTDEVPIVEPGKEAEFQAQERELNRRRDQVQAQIDEIEAVFRRKYASTTRIGSGDLDDLHYRYYRDSFEVLPDFDSLKPEDSGPLPRRLFDIGLRTRNESIGFVFEGTLIVPEDGRYTFSLDSDDGSRLAIDGKAIATYDGVHGEGTPQVVKLDLTKGRHPIRLDYFQLGHGLGLTVSWSGPGFAARPLSAVESEEPGEVVDIAALIRTHGERILGAETIANYRKLRRDLATLKGKKPTGDTALCVTEVGTRPIETFVLARGNPHTPADRVEPGFPAVLEAPGSPVRNPAKPTEKTTGLRSELADWIVGPNNPLPARVIANRLWQYHFGRGIVRSPNNFGTQGDRPTHPELLDWLASELVAKGWHFKALHKTLMTSSAYRMSSRVEPSALAKDPINDLFWRFDMRRLTGEEIRDSILAVSGVLNLKMYGPGVFPEIPREVMAGQSMPGNGWGKSSVEEQSRRSVYVHVKRSLLLPILESFDLPETDRSSPVRFSTTQPTQALGMLNGSFLREQAAKLEDRLRREAGDDPGNQVRLALRLVTCREPTEAEVKRGVDLIAMLSDQPEIGAGGARKAFCLVVLNLDEFLYLD